MIPRYYLHLYARTSEDMSLPRKTPYRTMMAAASPYRDIRANMEQTWKPGGLDQWGKMITTALDEGVRLSEEPGRNLHGRWTRSVISTSAGTGIR
jgi:hypothetical protein